jgi:hypothetical protein
MFPVIPHVLAAGCLGFAFLSCSQSWFLQHQVRLCVQKAAQIHFGSIIFHFYSNYVWCSFLILWGFLGLEKPVMVYITGARI